MDKLIEISSTVEFALRGLSKYTDNLFCDRSEKYLSKIKNNIKKPAITEKNDERYKKLISVLPDGIYTNVAQILSIIMSTKERNSVTSVTHSPLILSYPEFKCCKLMKYQKGHIITGRDQEIEQILLTLCKSSKRGVILVGEPGVGKTAVVNAINNRLIERTVPRQLIGCNIINMDIPYIFTKFKDDPIGTIIKVLERASTYDKAILFIDEVHQLLGHKMNDIMKPYLTEQIRFIGSTTINEYHSIITEDVALERRFTLVPIEEPNISKTIQMIKGTKSVLEKQHKCTISDEICEYAVKNGSRFLGHRRNPDKSLDLLDISCAIMDNTEVKINTVEYTPIDNFFKDLNKNKIEIESMDLVSGNRNLSEHYVNLAIAAVTNIPYNDIQNSLDYHKVLSILQSKVFGQDKALKELANVVNIFKHTKSERNRPIAVLALVGPSGTGKKSTAKCLASSIFGSDNRYIEFDMSGMTSEFMITELKGAPPGYVGYGKSGGLIKNIRNNPQSVVFFRGTNKADSTIRQYLIDCARNGSITDSAEREASLTNTIILHSITLSDEEAEKVFSTKNRTMGFSASTNETKKEEKKVNEKGFNEKALKEIMGEELFRSVDEIVIFNKLKDTDLKKIFEVNLPQYLDMYDVDIDKQVLESNILNDSKNGTDIVSRLASEVPKIVFNKLKE